MEPPLATNQLEFHLLRMDPIYDGTFAQCEKAGIRPMAWSPLARGRLFDPQDEAAGRLAEAAGEMAGRYGGASLDQLAYAWIMAHPAGRCRSSAATASSGFRPRQRAAEIVLEHEDWYALWEAAQGKPVP